MVPESFGISQNINPDIPAGDGGPVNAPFRVNTINISRNNS